MTEPTEPSSSGHDRASTLIILAALFVHLAMLFNAKPLQSANDRSRWCTVWSLTERGTFRIDEIRKHPGWDTIDLVHVDGHFYSTKPPLLTCLVAGLTWVVCRTTGWTLLEEPQAVTTTVLVFVNIVPFVLSLWCLNRLLNRLTTSEFTRLFVLTTAAFGTLLTPFLMTFNNHTVAAASVLFALVSLCNIVSQRDSSTKMFALCGASAAWACCNELPAAPFGVMLFVLALRANVHRTIAGFVPAAAIPLIAFVVTNWIATGSLKPTYADYGSDKYVFTIDGVPSYWTNPQGVDRNLDSPLMYFVHCSVGHHGIWSLSPVFLLSLAGWWMCRRPQSSPATDKAPSTERGVLWMICGLGACLTVILIAFYLTRTQNYNFGGVSCALRWSLWLTPFLLLALIPALDHFGKRTVSRMVCCGLLFVSGLSAWLPIDNPWQHPWLFQWMEARGWIDYSEEPPPLERPLWTWFASLPDPTSEVWVEYTSPRPEGTVARMKLSCRPPNDDELGMEPGVIALESALTEVRHGATETSIRTVFLHPDRFRAGAPPAECVVWPEGVREEEQIQSDLTFVRGLPLKQPFHPGAIRYLKTPLQKNAFRCQRAAAQVLYTPGSVTSIPASEENPTAPRRFASEQRYRTDIWLCPEIPFGVAQFEFHVTSPDGREVTHHERWTVSAVHSE